MFSKEEMIFHTFTYMNNVLSNTSVLLGCHMNLDFSSTVVPTLVSWGWGWLLSKLEGGWRLIFMDYSHEEFTSHRFRPTEMMHFGNNISGHGYNKANTFRLFFCSLQSKPQGTAGAVWWWWTVGLSQGNKGSYLYQCMRTLEMEQKKVSSPLNKMSHCPFLDIFESISEMSSYTGIL